MPDTFGLFFWDMAQRSSIEHGRTVAVNTLILLECFYLFNLRYISKPAINWQGLSGNPRVLLAIVALLIFQLGFTYLQPRKCCSARRCWNLGYGASQHWFLQCFNIGGIGEIYYEKHHNPKKQAKTQAPDRVTRV